MEYVVGLLDFEEFDCRIRITTHSHMSLPAIPNMIVKKLIGPNILSPRLLTSKIAHQLVVKSGA